MDDGDCAKRYEQHYFKVALANRCKQQEPVRSFERCADCGDDIPAERRKAMAKMGKNCIRCVCCQHKSERGINGVD